MSFETDLVLERVGRELGCREGGSPEGDPSLARFGREKHAEGRVDGHAEGIVAMAAAALHLRGIALSPDFPVDLTREHQEALRRASAVAGRRGRPHRRQRGRLLRRTPEIRVARRAPRATPTLRMQPRWQGNAGPVLPGGVHTGIGRRKLRDHVLPDLQELVALLQVPAQDADRGPQAEVVAQVGGGDENPTIGGERRDELAVQGVRLLLALRGRFVADHNVTVRAPAQRRCFLGGPALPTDRGPLARTRLSSVFSKGDHRFRVRWVRIPARPPHTERSRCRA